MDGPRRCFQNIPGKPSNQKNECELLLLTLPCSTIILLGEHANLSRKRRRPHRTVAHVFVSLAPGSPQHWASCSEIRRVPVPRMSAACRPVPWWEPTTVLPCPRRGCPQRFFRGLSSSISLKQAKVGPTLAEILLLADTNTACMQGLRGTDLSCCCKGREGINVQPPVFLLWI